MTKVIAEGITTWPADPVQLVGSKCGACGAVTFPAQDYCPKCSRPGLEEVLLPRTGTLVAWTTQNFYPGAGYAAPIEQWVPFNMGLVQLDDVVKVEARLTITDITQLKPGMRLELTMVPIATDADGNQTLTFAFQPA